MHACASAAKLRGGGPILTRGSKAIAWVGIPPPRTVLGSLPRWRERAAKRNLLVDARRSSGHRAQGDPLRGLAGGHQTPQRDQQLSREGDDHGFARAAAGVRRARPVPLRQRALLLEQEKAPGGWSMPRGTRALPTLAKPLSRRLAPLSSGD